MSYPDTIIDRLTTTNDNMNDTMNASMKRYISLIVLCIICLFRPALAIEIPVAPPPELNASAWLLLDVNTGQVLAEHNADNRIEPASLTKLLSAWIIFGAINQGEMKLTDTLIPSENAWKTEGSRMFIEPNKPVTVDALLHGMIIQSGNDATMALAERVGGSETGFVDMMNKTAQQLGMTHSHFMTATGLPNPQHYTTARDLSRVATALLRDYPQFSSLYAIKEYRYNNITQANRNRLLWSDPSVDGMKTGHTQAAGYCLIASAHRDQRRLLAVVLGTPSDSLRATETQRLLNYGFQSFDAVHLYAANQPIATLNVWQGKQNNIRAGSTHAIIIDVPHGHARDLSTTLNTHQPLLAPLSIGQTIGTLTISLNHQTLAQYPVQALDNDPVASWLGRLWDKIRMALSGNHHS